MTPLSDAASEAAAILVGLVSELTGRTVTADYDAIEQQVALNLGDGQAYRVGVDQVIDLLPLRPSAGLEDVARSIDEALSRRRSDAPPQPSEDDVLREKRRAALKPLAQRIAWAVRRPSERAAALRIDEG